MLKVEPNDSIAERDLKTGEERVFGVVLLPGALSSPRRNMKNSYSLIRRKFTAGEDRSSRQHIQWEVVLRVEAGQEASAGSFFPKGRLLRALGLLKRIFMADLDSLKGSAKDYHVDTPLLTIRDFM